MTKIVANKDKVVIKKDKPSEVSRGGIFLPESAQNKATGGIVVSCMSDSMLSPPYYKTGDYVIFKEYSGVQIEVDEETFTVVDVSDILVKVE